jgi:hypothetical protein
MRIASSNVILNSAQINVKTSSTYEYLHKWDKNKDVVSTSSQESRALEVKKTVVKDKVDATVLNNPIFHVVPTNMFGNGSNHTMDNLLDGSIGDLRFRLMKAIIEMMTGKEIKLLNPSDVTQCDNQNSAQSASNGADQVHNTNQRTPQGWGVDYFFNETHYSKEGASFDASGSVKTADGKTVNFNVSLEMSRETLDKKTVSLKAGDALIDPLMIDLSGTGVSFSNIKFNFDLAGNGDKKLINIPGRGSGFLAYDKNGNGLIDNGSELFGPATGNGFKELSAFDSDHNGWIDENDNAFSSLRIWQKSDKGEDVISTLGEKDVGALYCNSAETLFTIADSSNKAMAGRLKETGLWLKESGGVGILQDVDMAV